MSIVISCESLAIMDELTNGEKDRIVFDENYNNAIQTVRSNGGTLNVGNKSLIARVLQNADKYFVAEKIQTIFKDEDILKKTLRERGCVDFQDYENNFFTCTLGNMLFEFSQKSKNSNFEMVVKCTSTNGYESIANDLNEDYRVNTQEATYQKIKDRLSKKNLKISEEELLEDDSIVLTVNLD